MKLLIKFSIVFLLFSSQIHAQVTPARDGNLFYFEFANAYFEVDASVGGRISSFKVYDTEILSTTRGDNFSWGSTLWPSPQDEWTWSKWNNWPPPAPLDEGTYSGAIVDTAIILTSPVDDGPNLQFKKTFAASQSDTSFTITYTMINKATTAQSFAPWENTRVPIGGLSFFPKGEGALTGDAALAGAFTLMNDNVVWYQYNSADNGKKVFANGRERWRGHVNNEVLFVKQFEIDLDPNDAAEGENEIEEYIASGFHEIENQGAYVSIPAGDSITYSVKWYGRKVPDGITIEKGSEDLLAFARNVVNNQIQTGFPAKRYVSASNAAIAVYPTLVKDIVHIKTRKNNVHFRLFDINGCEIQNKYFSENIDLSLKKCAKGIYTYIIIADDEIKTGKLVRY